MTTVMPIVANARGAQSTTPFMVRAAAPRPAEVIAATEATPSAPSAIAIATSPALEHLTLTPRVLHVKDERARILDGAGVNSKLLATAPKCTKLEAIEEGGTLGDRWYKVKLGTGQDGWVAASAVTPSPCF